MGGRAWVAAGALCFAAAPLDAAHALDAGQPCAINATGALDSHLGHRTGEIHGGPWVVSDGADVTVTCEIEYGNAGCYDTPAGVRVSGEPRPHVGLLPPRVIEIWNPFQQVIYLGTTISWTAPDGSAVVRHVDFDATAPGAQCAVYDWGNEA